MTIKTNSGMQSYAYLWIIPADVSGQWRLTTQGGSAREYTLDVKQKYQEVSGTATSGGKAAPLTNFSVKGDLVTGRTGPSSPERCPTTRRAERQKGRAGALPGARCGPSQESGPTP